MVYRKQKPNTYFELRSAIVIEYHHEEHKSLDVIESEKQSEDINRL